MLMTSRPRGFFARVSSGRWKAVLTMILMTRTLLNLRRNIWEETGVGIKGHCLLQPPLLCQPLESLKQRLKPLRFPWTYQTSIYLYLGPSTIFIQNRLSIQSHLTPLARAHQ
ncbi:hypothetical protein BDV93DRAFT_289273 [Ceratobasidium sp. AG-I]|nr:hypothetical protein BDV93DRAFT_289273 [Ceratobasidium sp. AG-I]